MIGEDGRYIHDTSDILEEGSIAALEIRVSDTAAGSIVVDELRLRTQGASFSGRITDNFASEGNYTNAGGTGVLAGIDGASGRIVLLLSEQGEASAEYDISGAVRAEVRALSEGGSFAVLAEGKVLPFGGSIPEGAGLLSAYIGSDGLRYVCADSTWYCWNEGTGAFVAAGKLPQELTPAVRTQVFVGGAWKDAEGSLSAVSALGGGYTEEKYIFELPSVAEKLRVYFNAEWREQNASGDTGMVKDRAQIFALSSLTLYSSGEHAGTSAPQIVAYSGKTAYSAGERVELYIAAYDAESYTEDISVTVRLLEGDKTTELTQSSFVFSQACTVEITATDADGQTSSYTFEIAAAASEEGGDAAGEGGCSGVAAGCSAAISAVVITAAAALTTAIKRSKGRKDI